MVAPAHARFCLPAVLSTRSVCFLSAVVSAAFGNVHFASDNRLDVALAGFIKEICCGEKISVVRNGHRGHLLPRRFIKQLGSFARPVEQTEIRMNVEMNKLRLTHGSRF